MTDSSSEIFESSSIDPNRHLSLEALEKGLEKLAPAPTDSGRVVSLIARGAAGERATPAAIRVTPESGIQGDRWAPERSKGETRFGKDLYLEMQITTMEAGVGELIANGQPLALFGDNLIVDLDLSSANLPIGSRLRIGSATLEVMPFPHDGCDKYRARFGADALRFISEKSRRPRNLRGIYLGVVERGEIAVDDKVEILTRP